MTDRAYRAHLRKEVLHSARALLAPDLALQARRVRRVMQRQLAWLARQGRLLEGRGAMLRDGHGDLRPEHVFLGTPRQRPCVIDCLEFDPRLRRLDAAEEMAFLAMECARLGAARLGREVGLSDWVKVEVIGDQQTLYPDVQATLEATRVLVKEGFTVLPYTSDDIVVARRLIDAGAAAVMPLGAPIGSGLGIQNTANLRILRERITEVPLIVDAGVGTASDAAIAMELGADAVLMNSGIAHAGNPVLMAEAMQHAVLAGRQAYLAGRMPRKLYATASSPLEGISR